MPTDPNNEQPRQLRLLMVCLGNICRSPSAQGVFEKKVAEHAASQQAGISYDIDSAGTAAFHIGKAPDRRSVSAASNRGIDISHQQARQVEEDDFYNFDYIFAMDKQNFEALKVLQPSSAKATLALLLDYAEVAHEDSSVPDPYYSGEQGFELVLDLLDSACESILLKIATHPSEC